MTIAQALRLFPDIEADLLLAHILKKDKEFLYIHSDLKLAKADLDNYRVLAKKRLNGLPVAYILGYKYFYGLKFKTNKDVLIPRPETEWIVDEVQSIVKDRTKRKTNIIEVGTGSGCISISIASVNGRKNLSFTATDISPKALAVAKQNAKAHNAKIRFLKRNLLAGFKGKYDIIIANLPYVPFHEYGRRKHLLKHEPRQALTDGTDEFVLIAKLIAQAKDRLSKGGYLIIETDPSSIETLSRSVNAAFPKKSMLVTKDLQGLDRFITVH